jgi:hypothetical protein
MSKIVDGTGRTEFRARPTRTVAELRGTEMMYLRVIGFVIGFLLVLTFLFYVIGIYNLQ